AVEPTFADVLQRYGKCLLQRNRALQSADKVGFAQAREQAELWNDQLVDLGANLVLMRHNYIDAVGQIAPLEYGRISQKEERFGVTYLPLGVESAALAWGGKLEEEIRATHRKLLADSLKKDLATGSTSTGPHKDEILLTLGGNKVRFYGSQGEKRTCALALRLAEVAIFRGRQKRTPILLVDDISSELDEIRRRSLLDLLRDEDAQVFLTATELPKGLMRDAGRSFAHWELNNAMRAGDGHHGKNELHSG
ncbi:MAG: hypothetical protein HUU37_04470, partial [Bdellovibrionales bacterium]|nr:hypothetical protein [Bdellovibrionales bacterium]